MRRFVVLVTVVVLVAAMVVLSVSPALAITKRIEKASPVISAVSSGGTPVEPTWACETVAGVGGFQWRDGGEVCWLTLPGWDAAF